ncbi:hypothetical protein, partial [Salinispira pacifica]
GSVYLYENRDWTAKIAATRINQLGYAGVAPGDRFGAAVAMSLDGANVAAGAPGRRGTRGSVYLFREPEKGWNDNSNIMMIPIEPDAAAGDQFGTSVALSKYGDRLLVGAPALTARSFLLLLEIDWAAKNVVPRTVTLGPPKDLVALGGSVALSSDAGVIAASARSVRTAEGVVAYYRDDTRKWAKDYKVNSLSGPAEPYGAFGASVALSADGTSLVASVPREAGAVDGFLTRQVDRDAERAAEAALYAVDVRELGYATAISLDGKTAVVGAPAGDTDVADAGYVFLYEKTDTGWKVQAELTAGDGRASGDRFGEVVSVSSDGSTVAVGAPAASSPGIKAHGAVFIFTRPADGWPAKVIGPTARLQFNSPDTGDRMGHAVAVSGDGSIVVVGAPSRRNGQGAAVYYVRPAGGWSADTGESQRSLLFSSLELADGDRYGYSVAVAADASVVVVGAPGKKSTGEVVMVERPKEGWTEPKAFTVSTVPWEGYDLNGRKRFGKSLAVVPDGSAVLFGLDSADPAVGAVGKIMRKKNPDGKLTLSISYFENEIDAPFEMEDYGHALAVSAEGSVIAVGSLGKGNAGQLSILKFDTGDLSGRFRVYRKSFEGAVRYGTSVAVAPDGSIVRCGVPHYNGGAGAQDFLSVAEIFQ